MSDNISPPLPSENERGTIPAEQMRAILERAAKSATGNTETVAGAVLAQAERDAAHEQEARYVLWRDALSHVQMAQARQEAIEGAVTVAVPGVIGMALGGPIGAAVGCGVGWLYDWIRGE